MRNRRHPRRLHPQALPPRALPVGDALPDDRRRRSQGQARDDVAVVVPAPEQRGQDELRREEGPRRALEAEISEAMELELRAKQKAARDARYAARKQRRK